MWIMICSLCLFYISASDFPFFFRSRKLEPLLTLQKVRSFFLASEAFSVVAKLMKSMFCISGNFLEVCWN